jgi:hypothetical protein
MRWHLRGCPVLAMLAAGSAFICALSHLNDSDPRTGAIELRNLYEQRCVNFPGDQVDVPASPLLNLPLSADAYK